MTIGEMLEILAKNAGSADAGPNWPDASWDALRVGGALSWAIPTAYGGQGRGGIDLLDAYQEIAAACLTTCFILSQRDAAVRRICDHGTEELRQALLPSLARGDVFTTVGLSQLTTSRQFGKPAMTAAPQGDVYVLNGFMPWVTGAPHAAYFITGGAVDDGRQLLAVLPRETPGLSVSPALDLMALAGSQTAEVRCENVRLEKQSVIAGPMERVLATGRAGTGGLETSCLALGLAAAAIRYLHAEAASRPEFFAIAERLEQTRQDVRADMHHLVTTRVSPEAAAALRARANTLVLRATQTALTASKGAGFLRSHPAQRWARQALFFLVWSCPRPAAEATLAYLTPPAGPECALF